MVNNYIRVAGVALFTRAWIEIYMISDMGQWYDSRPLYEGVD